jgi:hypothetical protein
MIEGRKGKPRSHRYYRVIDIPSEHISTAAGGMGGPKIKHFSKAGIDFLGTGAQASAPPSVHHSGEVREWYEFDEPSTHPHQQLWAAVQSLAVACGQELPKQRSPRRATPVDTRESDIAPIVDPTEINVRAAAYIATIHAESGHGGHDQTFKAARALVNDFAMSREQALPLLLVWNQTNAKPPWDQSDLERKLDEAIAKGETPSRPRGCLLNGDRDGRLFDDPVLLASTFPGIWKCWHDGMYRYENTRYVEVADREVSGDLLSHIDAQFGAVYSRMVAAWEKGTHDH